MDDREKDANKKARSDYFITYQMYCERSVCDRLNQLKEKLAAKNLMFKFNGDQYAIFSLDIEDMEQVTDYVLTLEEAEDFAEKYRESEE